MKFPYTSWAQYAQIASTEPRGGSNDGLLQDESDFAEEAKSFPKKRNLWAWRNWRIAFETTILACSVVTLIAAVRQQPSFHDQQCQCGSPWGQWQANAEGALEYEVQRFKGSFGLQSPFTGIGPAVDAAWDNITDGPVGGAIGITKEQWEVVNEYPEYPVMLEQDHGSGRYLASLDVFHQLHCVDLLRKNIHRDYYDKHEGSFHGASARVIEGHLEHCVETLRQTLMCHGDISLLTYNWVEGRDMPYPNFNTIHTCKKWDTIVQWNMEHDVTVEWVDGERKRVLSPPSKPEGIRGMKTPP